MKSLLLLRHAEAVPQTPEVQEVQRELTEFGKAQCETLGKFLKDRAYAPDRIECSGAIRAEQTAELIARAAGFSTSVESYKHLYLASAEDLLTQAAKQNDAVGQLLLVAHAPGVGELASTLVTEQVDAALLWEPATLAEVVLDIDEWAATKPGNGELRLLLPGL
jgi:phosphohistidine phosphatase